MAIIDAQGTGITFDSQTVGNVISFSGLDGEATQIDITTLASTAKEFRQGLQDFGTFSMEMFRDDDDAGQDAIKTAQAAQSTEQMVVTLPDQNTLNVATFNCFVTSFSLSGGVDDVSRATANFKITGAVVWSDSTP